MHKTRKFIFENREGKPVEFTTKKFSFKLENKFVEMIGRDNYETYQANGTVDLDFSIEDVKEDFPELLEGDFLNIDWGEQDKATLAEVYFFFLSFNKSVMLNHQLSLNETVVSQIGDLAKVLDLTRINYSGKKKKMNTKSF